MYQKYNPIIQEAKETSRIKCKRCNDTITRYCIGRYPNQKDKIWVDKDGGEFNGKTCPSCHRAKARIRQRKIRES